MTEKELIESYRRKGKVIISEDTPEYEFLWEYFTEQIITSRRDEKLRSYFMRCRSDLRDYRLCWEEYNTQLL